MIGWTPCGERIALRVVETGTRNQPRSGRKDEANTPAAVMQSYSFAAAKAFFGGLHVSNSQHVRHFTVYRRPMT